MPEMLDQDHEDYSEGGVGLVGKNLITLLSTWR